MSDIFSKEDALTLLEGKKIVFIGDSILRSIYQDLLCLLENGMMAQEMDLKKKGEQLPSFMGDELIAGTGVMTTGRDYEEIRKYCSQNVEILFCFTTRCHKSNVDTFLNKLHEDRFEPDVILVLSALWDVSRWGPKGAQRYEDNCERLLTTVAENFRETQLIWLLCPPVAKDVAGAVLVEDLSLINAQFRFLILEGNKTIAATVAAYGFDVLDLHYYLMTQVHKRMNDGMHWSSPAVRYQTNLVLSHISVSRGIPLPKRWSGESNDALARIERKFKEKTEFQSRPLLKTIYGISLSEETRISRKRKYYVDECHRSVAREEEYHRSVAREEEYHRSVAREEEYHRSVARDEEYHRSVARDEEYHRSVARDEECLRPVAIDATFKVPNVPNSSRERETAKRELETAKNELEIAKQELETVKNERETVKSELEAVKSEVKTAKSEVKTAKSEVETAKLDDFPEFEPLYALATSSAQDPAGLESSAGGSASSRKHLDRSLNGDRGDSTSKGSGSSREGPIFI